MKLILTSLIMLLSLMAWGQQLSLQEWNKEAAANIRLLPKYGSVEKDREQKKADRKFIKETMEIEKFKGDTVAASRHLVNLGFSYMYKGDLKTAMYRFNQAYLLTPENSNIYWGYGVVYMTLGDYERGREQFEEGLLKDPYNPRLLTDYATYYMGKYYQEPDEEKATEHINSALDYLIRSYRIDNEDQNTLFKLSVCYWIKMDCDNAWKYYDECMINGGNPITEDYTADLEKSCMR